MDEERELPARIAAVTSHSLKVSRTRAWDLLIAARKLIVCGCRSVSCSLLTDLTHCLHIAVTPARVYARA